MTDSEVWQLIFAPGFSTAETVTDVSGRGVGMDVVKRNITAMGGSVDIRSAKGFGTTISISLPLTLAILDGMSIRCGEEVYILPLGFVVESLQPAPEDIKEIANRGRVIKVRGEYLPLIPLHQMFEIDAALHQPVRGDRRDPRSGWPQGRPVRRRPGRPAAGGGQEPRVELPQGDRDFRRHHPRRRRRVADPRRRRR